MNNVSQSVVYLWPKIVNLDTQYSLYCNEIKLLHTCVMIGQLYRVRFFGVGYF